MSAALLLLCHRPPRHLADWAHQHPDSHFYLHYDAKADAAALDFLDGLSNIHILVQRIDIRWAGFSMVQAMLLLLEAALARTDNQSFHFISGDCLPLQPLSRIAAECAAAADNTLWIDSRPIPRLRYRIRFNTPHADTAWQRSLSGKLLTKAFQAADRLLPSRCTCFAGSQWFSGNRTAMQLLADYTVVATPDFRRKLCPDEHFFQTLAEAHAAELTLMRDNRRYIRFTDTANHPDWLNEADLSAACGKGYWFARKVSPELIAAHSPL